MKSNPNRIKDAHFCAALITSLLIGTLHPGIAQSTPPKGAKNPTTKVDKLKQNFLQSRFVAYSPSDYDPRTNSKKPATLAVIRADLKTLRPYFNVLVTYACNVDDGTALVVPEADMQNFQIVLGIWDVKSVSEIETAVSLARKFPKTVIAIIVGNETQLFNRASWAELESAIRLVKTALPNVPVSTSEPISNYSNSALRRVVDFHSPNCHWIFQGGDKADIPAAIEWLKDRVEALQGSPDGNKPILIKEHGVPTGPAPFSAALQASYWKQWTTSKPNSAGCATVFFEFCDLPWKKSETNSSAATESEAHWGAWDEQRRPKSIVSTLPKIR